MTNDKKNSKSVKESKESFIHASCKPEEKGAWIAESRRKGMKLTEWIVETLNAAIGKK